MANEVLDINALAQMANAATRSGFFGYKDPSEAMTLMLVAQADGIHPMKAVEQYHIISGRPSLKSEAMLARFQAAGGKIRWQERTPERCTLWLSHPQGGELEIMWDMDRAKAARLTGNPSWAKYPAQMLSARCVSEGVRALFPACLGGFYTPEEVRDMEYEREHEAPKPSAKPAKAATVQPKPDAKQAFLESMQTLEAARPEAYVGALRKLGIGDISVLPDSDRRRVYIAVKKAVDEAASADQTPAEPSSEELDSMDIRDAEIARDGAPELNV